ncbi:sensor histidine kinase [Geomonas subterranea]|uniref:histidine kinase n=1 Tax=Geomonas subterranea TaxID=2847989 RepID=A0ABX8LKN4_9BACT|nr:MULTISPECIES: ATP-binding protein [Geomonas]QXE91471.1 HAMP domain-containing protein [Geomonas subterranea]QXM10441.1 HAMP domain-containing protein [Geomonas subterranea]
MKPFRFSLTFYILSALSMLLVLTWALLSLISFKISENDLLAQKGEDAKLLLSAIVSALPRPLAPPDADSQVVSYLEQLRRDRSFVGLVVVDQGGRRLYAVNDGSETDNGLLSVLESGRSLFQLSPDKTTGRGYAAIVQHGKVVGAARLTLSLHPVQERLLTSRHLFLAYFALDFLLLLVFGSYLLSRTVVSPIKRLLSATRRITAGDLGVSVNVAGSTEVAELSDGFNSMMVALREKRVEVEEKVASLKWTNKELVEARNEAVRSEKMASVGLLAAGMAHEIGTPLAAIMGYSTILAEELAADPEKSDYLRRIEEESRRIDRIVRGLLDYARPKRVRWEEVEIRGLLDKVVELLAGQGVLKHLEVSVEVEADLATVHADPHQLEQLLINLIVNARDAMPRGGSLWLKGRRSGAEVVIEVEDNGEGMAPELLGKVFDPFFTTKEPGKGTGLGLAIAARIAESCGGRLDVQSELGKGSRFTLTLPASGARLGARG